jgi:hypothetical protein
VSVDDAGLDGGTTLRNGSGENELSFSSTRVPLAGEEWQARVDVSAHPGARATLVLVSERALGGRATPFGELLVDVVSRPPLFTSLVRTSGASDVHVFTLPSALAGRSFKLQALILDREGNALTNAIDLVVGEGE